MSLSTAVLAAALACRLLWDFHEVEKQPGRGLALSPQPLLPLPPTGNGEDDGEGGCDVHADRDGASARGLWQQGAAVTHGGEAGPQDTCSLGSGGDTAVPCEACG